jgi:signal transduction histidine kinase
VVRHAQADQTALSPRLEERAVRLQISDIGIGIPIGQPVPAGSGIHGLMIMRQRAEAVGGEFKLSSTPGQGTRVEVSIPFQHDNRKGDG